MDASKILFMISIQLEIDKLEKEFGSKHQDVITTKASFQKLIQTEIQNKETGLDEYEFYDKLTPILNNTEIIIDKVNKANLKYDVIDSTIKMRASSFYGSFVPNTDELKHLKKNSIKCFEQYELSLKKEDHRLASKYLIMQLEGFLNIFKEELISHELKHPKRKGSQLDYIRFGSTFKTMPLMSMCYSLRDLKHIKFDYERIDMIIKIRNYESHQPSLEDVEENEDTLSLLTKDPSMYYKSVLNLITSCIKQISRPNQNLATS